MSDQDQLSFFGENRSLFSDYYLRERLHTLDEWKKDISEPFEQALELYRQKKSVLPGMNEAQTENEFIQPMLEQVLGFSYDVQKAEKKQGRINIPDYILFPDGEALKTAQQKPEEDSSYYNDALTLSDAKYWERPLDSKSVSEKDRFTNNNPSFQIIKYLTVTGLEWGILTNGSRWRLYSTKSRSRIDSYFEVDLKRILEEENKEQFRYFYQFFRRQAYQPDPQTGQHFVDRVFEASTDYGSRLEKKLKDLIFDDIFLELSKGFVHYRSEEEGIRQETEESLQEIYQGTLRLLYRLLFLLHAESRSLLPLDNKGYLQYSLMELKKDIANRIDKDLPQSSRSFDVWNDLDSLFHIIDKGDPDLNVPRYNGGLFRQDHSNNEFLQNHKISDKYLVPALELLTRETEPRVSGRKPFIDYKSLNVEQLGSIYEGLLEYHLRQACHEEGQGKELYLENDKGERKATGSYYTPHYIVEYIVERTLGPVFEERKAIFEDLMDNWLPKYKEYLELDQRIQDGDRSEQLHKKRKELDLETRTLSKRATETLLNLKICDPAMGSGHFLKEATDKLAEKIIMLLAEYPTNPVTNLLEDVRDQILESLDAQNINIDAEEHLKDTNLIKRMVMKRSIYGVDLNPMAVELAKLSLWLDSFTVGAPLSFLDHHLKVGNSLIGTTVKEVKRTLELDDDRQIEAFGGPFSGMLTATELMRDVSLSTDATFSEIKASIGTFNEYENAVKPYKRLLDLWISRHFDNDKAIALLRQYPGKVIEEVKGEKSDLHDNYVPVLEGAEKQADEKKFFHWELEFPEVFVNLRQSKWLENPGFDAVVGNPPYDVLEKERLGDRDPHADLNDYLKVESFYKAASGGKQNLFRPFLIRANNLINNEGAYGQIIPLALLTDQSCTVTLKSLLKERFDFEIQAFPQKDNSNKRVFPEAKLSTCILIGKALESSGRLKVSTNPGREILKETKVYNTTIDQLESLMDSLSIPLAGHYEWEILKKIYLSDEKESLENLLELSRGEINLTIYREYITDDENCDQLLKGSQVGVYNLHEPSQGNVEWFNNDSYKKDKGKKKEPPAKRIALQRISGVDDARRLTGTLIDEKVHFSGSLNSLASDDESTLKFVLALLNSTLLNWCFHSFSTNNNISTGELAALPIKEINFSKFDPAKNAKFLKQLEDEYQKYLEEMSNGELLALTEEFITDEEEYRLPIIHDFLADLSEKMLDNNKEKQRLDNALDPFKFLNKGVVFNTFSDVFADAIKYGVQLTSEVDIGTDHHDIEKLGLRPEGDKWVLCAHLKHRDPDSDWDDWVKENEYTIHRTIQDIYRFELTPEKARYWQQSFEVLDDFENSSNFPGGKTRSTFEKLMKSEVPVFDESANIEPLIELREELSEVKGKIEKTDWLIDQVVYQLYGLSEEEIEIVEESVR